MRVELSTVERYAGRRLADVTTFRAIGNLMDKVGQLPDTNWGELPWSPYWAHAWKTACQGRQKDATSSRDAFLDTANRLLQAASSYYHTDVHASVSFDKIDPTLNYYLAPHEQENHSAGTFHPGGGYAYSGRPFIPGPWKDWGEGPEPEGNRALLGADPLMCPPLDDLAMVLSDHGELLDKIEKLLDGWGVGNPHLYSQYLIPASKANPPLIKTHAEEILHAASVYQDALGRLKNDNWELLLGWTGAAGEAAQHHVQNLYDYVTACHTEALWLGQTGDQCATVLANLRTGYARATHNHIEAINDAYQEVAHWFSSWGGFVAHIAGKDWADATKDLTGQLNDALKDLVAVENEQQEVAKDLLTGEITASQMPDVSTNAHEHHDLPPDGSPRANAWADPRRWNS